MNTTTDLPRIPLAKLHLSPLNARKTRSGNVDDLAASIAAHGLLQNLTVTVNDNPGEFEVVAGGRRLAAIQQLDREGRLPDALQAGVPCLVIENNDVAHEASTAENTLREDMHPADQFEAFCRMVDGGKPVEDIAAHFGVAEAVVKQRLKLARVAPELVQLYRAGDMELSELQAFTVSDDHDKQLQVWNTLPEHYRHAYRIREALVGDKAISTDSELVKFVGLDAYEAAGGAVSRDLFGGKSWCEDGSLLDKLAMDLLEAKAQQLREDGWSWAEAHLSLEYDERAEYGELRRPASAEDVLPPELEARLKEINARIEEIDANEDDDLWEERSDLDDEADAIGAAAEERWPAEAMAKSGCLVTVNSIQGRPQIYYGRLKPGQKADKSGAVTGSPKAIAAPKKTGEAQKPVLSALMHMVLSAHTNEAVRYNVARNPALAMALLIDRLIAGVKGDHSSADVLRINTLSIRQASHIAPDVSKALKISEHPGGATTLKIPKAGRIAFLLAQPLPALQAMLAFLVAQTFDGMSESPERVQVINQLRDALGIDMADHWNPTCDGFLGRIHADLVAEAVTEAVGKDAAATLKGLKKDERVATAAKLLAGTGWLPKPLRGPGYVLKTTAPAKPAVAKKPAKKPTVKPKPLAETRKAMHNLVQNKDVIAKVAKQVVDNVRGAGIAKPKTKAKPTKKRAAKKAKAGKS